MLDSEPDNNATTTPDETPKRPRRRAASRPAGPPASVTGAAEAPAVAQSQDAQSERPASGETSADPDGKATSKAPARKTAAKKTTAKKSTPRKTTAKKAAEAPATESAETPADSSTAGAALPGDADDAPPTKKTARKTAAKKTTTRTAAKRTSRKPAAETAAEPSADEQPEPVEATELVDQPESAEPAGTVEPIEAVEPTGDTEQPSAPEPSIEAAIELAMNATLAQRGQTGQDNTAQDDTAQDDTAQDDSAQDDTAEPDTAQVAEAAALEGEAPETAAADETAAQRADADSGESGTAADSEEQEDGGNHRRRRRRGGRRRRRGRGDRDDSADDDSPDSSDDTAQERTGDSAETAADVRAESTDDQTSADADRPKREDVDTADDHSTDDDSEDGDSGDGQRRRRRRRRRRRGEEATAAPDDPSDVVVRVREPRKASDEVTGIDGSTRMEAKRQRRREGREAGRRRAPIISEAEFLARRESVNRKMVIRQREDLSQIAVLEDGILVEHYVDRESANSLIGNVYLGRVQNVLPSMEAAFIDIGRGRNAVLYAGELDWDSFGAEGHDRKVENVLKSGQTVLVQVTKDPVGAKGARLTNHVSIPGRYVVYAPGGHLSGISRKLPENERKRLKDILDAAVDDSASVIVRTAAEGASEKELTRDVNRLKAQWEDIEQKVKSGNAPQLLYAEPDLTLRIVRDLFTEDFSELIVQGNSSMNDAYDALQAYMQHVAPHLLDRIKRWDAEKDGDLFGSYRLDEQIAKGLERKVFLPSGGSLIIDRTEAMTVIDVNTGKFTGSGGNLEATITSNNLEAAEEIVRQLRLRDIGGIIVIDFIDMVLPSNRELLLRRLVECLGRDRTRHQVAEVTSLGLVQMTRKRIGTGLLEAFSTECPHCHGRGVELHDVPVADAKLADGGARDDHGSRSGRRRGGKGGRKGGDKTENKPDKGEHQAGDNGDKSAEKTNDNAPAEVPAAS